MTSSIILELTNNSRPYYFKAVGFYNDKNLLVHKDGETAIKLISGQFPPDEYNFFNTNSNRLYRFETFSGHIFSAKVYSIDNCLLPEKMCQIIIHCSLKVKRLLLPNKPRNSGYSSPNEGSPDNGYIDVLPNEGSPDNGYIDVLPNEGSPDNGYIEVSANEEVNGGVRTRKHHTRSRKHKSRRARLTLRRNSIRNH